MYKVNFYHERYNMDCDYYTGDEDIDLSASFKHWQDMIRFLDLMLNTYEGETYSVWDGDTLLCGGAFDPDDKDIILENLGMVMNTYNIGFSRIENGIVVADETQFDVPNGNETDLLELFIDFIIENGFQICSLDYIELVCEP